MASIAECCLHFKSFCTAMLLSHIKRLCIILPSLIAATPQDTDPTSSIPTSLPATLQHAVPACAQPCLRASLFEQFPLVCTSPININCLCSRYSLGGSSLGEVALGCIYASCPTVDSQAASAYNICLGQKDAVKPTKTALTVTAGSFTRSRLMTTSRSVVTTRPTPTVSSLSRTRSSSFGTVVVDSVSFTPSATSSATSSPSFTPQAVAPATTPEAPRTMKPAQIAGLSVAAAATFIVAIGLMALSVFFRKRRERRQMMTGDEKRLQGSPPPTFPSRLSRDYSTYHSPRIPPRTFPLQSVPKPQALKPYSNRYLQQANPNTAVYAVRPDSGQPKHDKEDFSSVHPLLRPGAAQLGNSSSSALPLDQIGLAISAEGPGKSATTTTFPQPPRKAAVRQQAPESVRPPVYSFERPDSTLTQDTVFEEDVLPARRRSSKLLPTPQIPVPPIRTFQPSRPAQTFNPDSRPTPKVSNRQQAPQQPGLSLNIPIRHSRSQPKPLVPAEAASRKAPPSLAPPIRILSVSERSKSRSTSTSISDSVNEGDIPDYYFTAHKTLPTNVERTKSPARVVRPQESPKLVSIRPKGSASTVSRATSRASTNVRDSISSQTSFETVNSNDPTPEDDDDDKQLSDENRLSPVAESPISNLRYPKVPRASNQLVPRSPKSPQSQRSQGSPRMLPEPSALLVKRRGEKEALNLESRLHMGSPNRTEVRNHMKNYRKHIRSNSVEAWSQESRDRASDRQTRVQSGQWPKSPAMYDADTVQPLNIRSRQQQQQQPPPDMNALKSPLWVPRLTPTRQGEDLFISVTYSKPAK